MTRPSDPVKFKQIPNFIFCFSLASAGLGCAPKSRPLSERPTSIPSPVTSTAPITQGPLTALKSKEPIANGTAAGNSKNPLPYQSWLIQGRSLAQGMHYKAALPLLHKAELLAPKDPEVALWLFVCYKSSGPPSAKALEYAEKFLSTSPVLDSIEAKDAKEFAQEFKSLKAVQKSKRSYAQVVASGELLVKEGQRLECLAATTHSVQLSDCEWFLDTHDKFSEERFYEALVQVTIPKGMIVTVARSRVYKGHTITKLHLEEPLESRVGLVGGKPGAIFSDVWAYNEDLTSAGWRPTE